MHYKNGRLAQIGDPVVGTVFNNGGKNPQGGNAIIAGTLVSLTPGPDSCSALVGYNVTIPLKELETKEGLKSRNYLTHGDGKYCHPRCAVAIQGTEQHGSGGELAATYYVQDYTECKFLLHAEDAFILAQPISGIAQGGVATETTDKEPIAESNGEMATATLGEAQESSLAGMGEAHRLGETNGAKEYRRLDDGPQTGYASSEPPANEAYPEGQEKQITEEVDTTNQAGTEPAH